MKLILVGLLVTILAVHRSEQAGIHRRSLDADEHQDNDHEVGTEGQEILKNVFVPIEYDFDWMNDVKQLLKDKFEKLEQHLDEKTEKLEEHLKDNFEDLRKTIVESIVKEQTNFVKIGLKYYYIEDTEELNWFEAADSCRRMGANLASPQNEEEFNALNEMLANSRYWLGINDLGTKGAFRSSISGKEAEYVNWHKEEPNDSHGAENCVELRLIDEKRAMNDLYCQVELNYICEKNSLF